MTFLLLGVYSKVFIRHDNFLIPVVYFLLPYRIFFSDHVISTHKNCLEEGAIRECFHTFNLLHKVRFTLILWPVLFIFELVSGFGFLPVIWNCGKLVDLGLWRSFRVKVEVFFFIENIKAVCSLPGNFIVLLCLLNNFVFVDPRKS